MSKQFAPIRNPEAVAWTIAAEGTISIHRSHSKGGVYYYPYITVSNTKKDFIDNFKKLVGDYGSAKYSGSYAHQLKNPKHNPSYFWAITSIRECRLFLNEIIEYLHIKREQAELVVRYCINRINASAHQDSITYEDEAIVNSVQHLNERGVHND
jgi:midasin (ATPase involved in ribosome maturation)